MSVASPTVLPRPPLFPRLLPKIQHPHPAPLPPQSRTYGHLKAARNLQREMDDLSDEENEIEEMNILIKHRGFTTLVPIGRSLTQQEEKNDAEEDDETDSAPSNGPPSVGEDVGENSTQDLDASMEDLDEEGEDEDESDEDDEEATDEVEESSEV
ncbi:hypothetical protein GGX14DRAFT_464609 [Mycena pura]|uniref:Uncharacterized protein n=1 Tax=Mycena pura TaxID=153505 RepID=A0AAD6V7G0_9AGAR|nr:hypothetical protein GGX14DRAFT_464609 [Mycena pura]